MDIVHDDPQPIDTGDYSPIDLGDIPPTQFTDIVNRGGNNPDGQFTIMIE
jgi:hypothetical protein